MSITDYAQGLQEAAQYFAMRAKAVASCPFHDDTIINQYDDDAAVVAYKMANAAITRGEIDFDRSELSAAIRDAIDMSADECGYCEANARD